ncbi:hypothetical protein BKA62DRAFT_777195 [Auriculariales sp. MPI-PUGE-AT-0066]|nr:hypothetical protein BKA62DRAFT_777195 [Auriculariales sp. MPI-PUGE-AT-0066]
MRQSSTSADVIQNLRHAGSSRIRSYIRHVEVVRWLWHQGLLRLTAFEESDESENLTARYRDVLSLLEELPNTRSLKMNYVPLQNDTLGQICSKLPMLTEIELGYCNWSAEDPVINTLPKVQHALKHVTLCYCVPSPTYTTFGGCIQIPALLYAAHALIHPTEVQNLSLVA